MSEYREKRTIVEEHVDRPVGAMHPVVHTQYESVVDEPRGMSGVAVAGLVVAGIAAAIVITMLIISGQQRTTDQQLAQDRAKSADTQAPLAQPAQQPLIVQVPAAQPAPAAAPPVAESAAPSSSDVEKDVNSRLLGDQELRSYALDVKVSGGTATLSGRVPYDDLKTRAERLAMTVKGVHGIINNITVQS